MANDDEEFIPEIDIKFNDRRHDVTGCLRFKEEGETTQTEILRNEIWEGYIQGMTIREIAKAVGLGKSQTQVHLKKCKQFYDKWVSEHGLSLHGDPANRLEDTLQTLQSELDEIKKVAKECLLNGDTRGYKDLKKLEIDVIDKMAKFKGVEPEKNLNINLTSAEETRKKMEELFPSEFD